jgi:alkyl sulfatase BDS1-like metallo-beta-lactamase superfamily hydrolase
MMNRRRFLYYGTAGVASPLLALGCGSQRRGLPATAAAPAGVRATTPFAVTPGINPDLKAHGAIFERKIHKVGDNIYVAVGWSICNTIMVIGGDGVIIVDTGTDIQSAREVAAEFRKITDKPVQAVIYTCFHSDHINGVKAYASAEDVKVGRGARLRG